VKIQDVVLRATVADYREGPREPLPQVAFAGRSNVGKSSLLNCLFGRRLALVSKTPGKTRTINYYAVNNQVIFVDLPGYGYARRPLEERQSWGERISAYLAREPRLALVVGLVDPRVPTSPLDVDLVRFARQLGKPLVVVLTKSDALGRGALAAACQRAIGELGLADEPIVFSSRTGAGRHELLGAIAGVVGL
jgi:GTP-binding protein